MGAHITTIVVERLVVVIFFFSPAHAILVGPNHFKSSALWFPTLSWLL